MWTKKIAYFIPALLLPFLFTTETEAAADTEEIPGAVEIEYEFRNHSAYSVVDTAANHILDQSRSLRPFMKKLQGLQRGDSSVISIVHIGDSHIQAGFLTTAVRRLLQRQFGDAGRGLIAPLRIAGTNEPLDYRISSPNRWTCFKCTGRDRSLPIGPSAMSIVTEESEIGFTITSRSEFSRIRAFHPEGAPLLSFTPEYSDFSYCAASHSPQSSLITLEQPVSAISLAAGGGGESIYYGFSLENGSPGILYHSVGINGAAYDHYNNYPSFIASTRELDADLIIISLGTNDTTGGNFSSSYFKSRVMMMVESIMEANPNASIILTTPMENCRSSRYKGRRTYSVNANVPLGAEAIKTVAAQKGIACWDLYSIAGGKGSCAAWLERKLYFTDRLHMTLDGYSLQGEMLYEAIVKYYNQSLTDR